jgi:hypothetical protein
MLLQRQKVISMGESNIQASLGQTSLFAKLASDKDASMANQDLTVLVEESQTLRGSPLELVEQIGDKEPVERRPGDQKELQGTVGIMLELKQSMLGKEADGPDVEGST